MKKRVLNLIICTASKMIMQNHMASILTALKDVSTQDRHLFNDTKAKLKHY